MSEAETHSTTGVNPGEPNHDVDPADLVDIIQTPNQGSIEHAGPDDPGGWLPQLDLPGFGSEYDGSEGRTPCGEDIPHFCTGCAHHFDVGRTCARSTCPRCAPAWVMNRAGTSREKNDDTGKMEDRPGIVSKLDTVARVMSADLAVPVYKHHVVFSPPKDWFLQASDPLNRTFHVIRDIMKEMNAEGMVAYHPWSGDDSITDDRGEWNSRLFSGRDFEGDVRNQLKARPHFHAIVASPFIPGKGVVEDVNDETDWVIHRVEKRDGSGKSLEDLHDVADAVTYSLSHTGIDTTGETNRAAYRCYGSRWHDDNLEVYDDIMKKGDRAVREVAPTTLGISGDKVRCKREISKGARDENAAAELTLDHLDAADDGAGVEETATTEPDVDDEMVDCGERVLPIDQAPQFLEDAKWRARVSHADSLQTVLEEWEANGRYPGG